MALVILIILVCATLVIVATKDNESTETKEDGSNKSSGGQSVQTDYSDKLMSPLVLPDVMPKNCKEIKDGNPDAKNGLYLIRIESRKVFYGSSI